MAADVSGLKEIDMKAHWRKLIELLPLSLQKGIYRKHFSSIHEQWLKDGKGFPPSHLSKQQHLRKWASANNLKVLIETGTYLGDMVFAMQDDFRKIISIELADVFYRKAVVRFNKQSHIEIMHGDSGKVLRDIIPAIKENALIWLDGHYSGGMTAKGEKECPVYEELHHVFASPFNHTILIDDARLFIGKNDYPTIEELKQFVASEKPAYHFLLENDAIIITPSV